MTEQKEMRPPVKAVLLAVDLGQYDAQRSLEELAALAEANGMEPVGEVLQKRDAIDVATVLGEGRVAEAKLVCQNLHAEVAIFDGELSGSQIRNMQDLIKCLAPNRRAVIEVIGTRAAQ